MTPEQIEIERKKFEDIEIKNGNNTLRDYRDESKYWSEVQQSRFEGWLACCESRESVCVVLPKKKRVVTNAQASYNKAIDDFVFLLQSSGISYREEE